MRLKRKQPLPAIIIFAVARIDLDQTGLVESRLKSCLNKRQQSDRNLIFLHNGNLVVMQTEQVGAKIKLDDTNTPGQPGILFVCHECDALQQVPAVAPGNDAICVRCGSRLFRNPKSDIDKPLAYIIASMILFVVANTQPIMSITILGIKQEATISDAAWAFIGSGSPEIAALVWLPSVLIPGLTISLMFYVLFSIRFRLNWPYAKTMLKWISRMLPWGMMDVFLLGIIVSLVKLVSLAEVALGIGFYAFLMLIFLYAASIASLEPHTLWESLAGDDQRQPGPANG